MRYADIFEISAANHPEGGARLSPAACAFILPEIEALVRRYADELENPAEHMKDNSIHTRMVEHHLNGLRYIAAHIEAGTTNKTEQTK